jgi:DNA N-6-adenine-methyltransferase Dam
MTLGSHQQTVGKSQVHITPKWIIERLGPFDLDPAAADPRPWDCAGAGYTERDDGLRLPWHGRVWLNPPFDRYVVAAWMRKLAKHGHGTALLHARVEAEWFEPCWESASGILFMADRIHFHRPDGSRQGANSGAPPCLVAFGEQDLMRLRSSGIAGALITQWDWRPADRPADLFSALERTPPYDAADDSVRSYDECLREVRARVAAGGEGWKPK